MWESTLLHELAVGFHVNCGPEPGVMKVPVRYREPAKEQGRCKAAAHHVQSDTTWDKHAHD